MVRSIEATAQRRKLLGEIERLAAIAIFGTLSETYRTCGRAGCHCQGHGPKHGPHLNVSYPSTHQPAFEPHLVRCRTSLESFRPIDRAFRWQCRHEAARAAASAVQ